MKLYLAAGFTRQYEIKQIAYKLRHAGIEIVSTWHDNEESDTDTANFARYAERDFEELDKATGLVLFNGPTTGGGRHVELGFVLAWNWMIPPGAGKYQRGNEHSTAYDIYIVGPLENVFQYMEAMNIQQFSSTENFIEAVTQQFARTN